MTDGQTDGQTGREADRRTDREADSPRRLTVEQAAASAAT